jgi:hypothetical protein
VRWIAREVDYLEKILLLLGRILYVSIAPILLYIAARAALAREIFRPPRLRPPRGIHISGEAKNLLALAALFGAVSLLTQVAYNYRTAWSSSATPCSSGSSSMSTTNSQRVSQKTFVTAKV